MARTRMAPKTLAALLAALVMLSGCFGGGGDVPDDTPDDTPDGSPEGPFPAPEPLPHHPGDGTFEEARIDIESFDGHLVPANLCRPTQAGPNATVPILLHSHGWAGSKSGCASFEEFFSAGFGVVSFDMRGHGEADDVARVHRMEYEIRDVMEVITFAAGLDWVHLDAPGDPRIGALGGSYGGAYQLLTAAVDPRLDAIAPEITWNSLPQSLAPNGAPKSAWVDLLFLGAYAAGVALEQDINEAYLWVQATNRIPDGSLPSQPDILTPFTASSPGSYPDAIRIPTLLIQGTYDTLFNFNEAAHNFAMINATGAPTKFVTHLHGHILNTEGTIPDDQLPVPLPFPLGLQPPAGGNPCGAPRELILPFYERHLIGLDVDTGPRVCFALQDGSTVTGDDHPLPGTEWRVTEPAVPLVVAQGPPGARTSGVLFTAQEETVIAGIPRLQATVTAADADAIVYVLLEVIDGAVAGPTAGPGTVVNAQVTPLRITTGVGSEVSMDLMGVGLRLLPGQSLAVVATNFVDQYAHNADRTPGLVVLDDVVVTLPIVPA